MLITLLTDFGTKDASVAGIKALVSRQVSSATVVDLSHGVRRHDWRQAAYLIAGAYAAFPEGTVHMIPVGVVAGKSGHRLIHMIHLGRHFLAPDNGLLPDALGKEMPSAASLCRKYEHPPLFQQWIEDAVSVCRAIEGNNLPAYPSCELVAHPDVYPAQVSPVGIACQPLYSDRYRNIVLNIREDRFRELVGNRSFSIRTFKGGAITSISTHYNDVPAGAPLCRFNNAGYLEIAVNHGSALDLFGIHPSDADALSFHTVRISVR